jgi:hypothetical protein
MTRRFFLCLVFASFALSSTGCCGVFRNFVYRVRNCGSCYPGYGHSGFGGGCASDAYSVSGHGATPHFVGSAGDSASLAHDGGFGGGYGAAGCQSCTSSAAPMISGFGGYAGVPMTHPGYAGTPMAHPGYAGVPTVPSFAQPHLGGQPNTIAPHLAAPSYPGISGKYLGAK